MLIHLKQLLTPDELAQSRALLGAADAPWIDGRRSAGAPAVQAKNNEQLAQDSPSAPTRRAFDLILKSGTQRLNSCAVPTRPRLSVQPVASLKGSGLIDRVPPGADASAASTAAQ